MPLFIKAYPRFTLIASLILALLTGLVTFELKLIKDNQTLASKESILVQKINKINMAKPSPTQGNLELARNLNEHNQSVLSKWILSESALNPKPQSPTEALTQIHAYNNWAHQEINKRHIHCNASTNLGFDYFIAQGVLPEANKIDHLYLQKESLKVIMEALIGSQPDSIISVNRYFNLHPDNKSKDIFQYKGSGLTESSSSVSAFCIRFSGSNQSLRLFINKMNTTQMPLFIQKIEVEGIPIPSNDQAIQFIELPHLLNVTVTLELMHDLITPLDIS